MGLSTEYINDTIFLVNLIECRRTYGTRKNFYKFYKKKYLFILFSKNYLLGTNIPVIKILSALAKEQL